jgi:hypothetical protein
LVNVREKLKAKIRVTSAARSLVLIGDFCSLGDAARGRRSVECTSG